MYERMDGRMDDCTSTCRARTPQQYKASKCHTGIVSTTMVHSSVHVGSLVAATMPDRA
jgi:hypothetical protein